MISHEYGWQGWTILSKSFCRSIYRKKNSINALIQRVDSMKTPGNYGWIFHIRVCPEKCPFNILQPILGQEEETMKRRRFMELKACRVDSWAHPLSKKCDNLKDTKQMWSRPNPPPNSGAQKLRFWRDARWTGSVVQMLKGWKHQVYKS